MKDYFAKSFLTLIIIFSCSVGRAQFKMNDVSVLYPIATADFSNYYLGMDSQGLGGELLSTDQFKFINDHLNAQTKKPGAIDAIDAWRVLSVRIDPCSGRQDGTCVPEIRLVAQPVVMDMFRDSALHLVYELSKEQFESFVTEQKKLNVQHNVSQPDFLTPHTSFTIDKKSSFQNDYEALLLKNIGQGTLFRVAIMIRKSDDWFFANYNAAKDAVTKVVSLVTDPFPHSHGAEVQVFSGKGFNLAPMTDSTVSFIPNTHFPNFVGDIVRSKQLLFSLKAAAKEEADRTEDEQKSFEWNQRLHGFAADMMTNTKKFSRFNTDCFSCHMASQALKYSQTVHEKNVGGVYPFAKTKWPLVYSAEDAPQSIISFGYVFKAPSISDRVRTESEEVIEAVNKMLAE